MTEDLMIEITGSATKATSAIGKVISKLSEMQSAFEKVCPSLTAYTEKMNSIATSSKAFVALKNLTESTNKQALSSANAESKMAMYQARLDRSTVSMERSKVASEKLAAARKKLQETAAFDASNKQFLDNYKYTGYSNKPSNVNKYSEPSETDAFVPTPPRFIPKVSVVPKSASFNMDTTQATSAVDKMRTYIDSLTPSISRMSQMAQGEFSSLSAELIRISNQIDNQRALYSQLASAATTAANANGEGSEQYLRLEKRMLSADGAIENLIQKQEKLKASMGNLSMTGSVNGYTSAAAKATVQTSLFGREAKKASSSATSGFQKTLNMMEKMFIRIIAFRIFSAVSKAITDGMNNIAQASKQANASISAIATSSLYLKNSIASAFAPLIQSLTPIITQFIDTLADLFNMLGMLNARIFNHASTVTIAKKAHVDYAASIAKTGSNAKKTADEIKRSIMGFDELNILTKSSEKSSAGSAIGGTPAAGDMFQTVKIPDWVNGIGDFTDPIGKIISNWWGGLTDAQKWGAGAGATAGVVIGGIIGHLICPGIGTALGMMLGGVAGSVIGAWWAGLTTPEKWSAGIGAGAGVAIGGIIGGLIGGKIGAVVGATLGGVAGAAIGKWWADLTTPEKWSVGIGAGAGTVIGGIVGGILTGGNPIGIVVGAALGGTIGSIIGKWWEGMTAPQKWSAGVGAGAGATIGGIIGTLICPGLGTVLGAALGGTLGTVIATNWQKIQDWFSSLGADIQKRCSDIGVQIGDTLKGAWNNVVSFFTTDIPKWINSVGDWFNKLPYKIGYAMGQAVASVVNFGVSMWKWVTTELPEIIVGIVNWFAQLPGRIWTFLVEVVTKVGQWGTNLVSTAQTEIPKFVRTVVDFIGELPGKMLDIGKNIVHGIWDGITGAVSWLHDKISGFCSGIVDGFKDNLQIHSPSKLFADVIGKNLALGLGYGFTNTMQNVSDSMIASMPTSFGISADVSVPTVGLTPQLAVNTDSMASVNNNAFSNIGKGINGNGGAESEEILYRAFSRALQDMPMSVPEITTNNYLDGASIASKVETRIKRKDRRYNTTSNN